LIHQAINYAGFFPVVKQFNFRAAHAEQKNQCAEAEYFFHDKRAYFLRVPKVSILFVKIDVPQVKGAPNLTDGCIKGFSGRINPQN
jgi:hypothetical protein